MDVKVFRSVLVLAEELHFGRAAARLALPRSVLSEQIARVERDLGMPLFRRTSRHVSVTPAGRAVIAQLAKAVEELDTLIVIADRAARAVTGTLRVGFVPGAAGPLLTATLRAYGRRMPGVDVVLVELPASDGGQALRAQRVDLQFMPLPVPTGLVATGVLAADPVVALVPRAHPAAALATADLADLAPLPLLHLGVGVGGGSAEEAGGESGWREALGLVATGRAVALVPASAGRRAGRGEYAVVRVNGVAPRHIVLAGRPGMLADPVVAGFVDTAAAATRDVVPTGEK